MGDSSSVDSSSSAASWHGLAQGMADLIARHGITDPRLLGALQSVPRHLFVPLAYQMHAYGDFPLDIGEGQTISQPYIVARMIELSRIAPESHVLEVGAGSGYALAVLAHLASSIVGLERLAPLAQSASKRLKELGYNNVSVYLANGAEGWPAEAPFDAIIVSAASLNVPQPLFDQLKEGGYLVAPLGLEGSQHLYRFRRLHSAISREKLEAVRFVPLIV